MNSIMPAWLLVLTFVLSGCAIFPKSTEIRDKASDRYGTCAPVLAYLSYSELENSLFAMSESIDLQKAATNRILGPSIYVSKEVFSSGFFNQPASESQKPDVMVNFATSITWHSNIFQHAWYWGTFLTFGLLPSYGYGEMKVTATVTNLKDDSIATFESEAVNFRNFNGLIFFPLNFWQSTTLSDFQEKVLPSLTSNVLRKMQIAKEICK